MVQVTSVVARAFLNQKEGTFLCEVLLADSLASGTSQGCECMPQYFAFEFRYFVEGLSVACDPSANLRGFLNRQDEGFSLSTP